jgi:Zn-dependent M28 family amino/carboxypeptidase
MVAVALTSAVLAPGFASQSGKTAAANAFDGERALMHTRDVVAFGPRPAGSSALEQTRQYIEMTLGDLGLTVQRDEFVASTPIGEIPMANLIAEVPAIDGAPDGPVIIFSGHYDTLLSEAFEFVGANDAGSSTGILLEFARVFTEHPPPLPLWLVFFDGEEALVEWSETDSRYGSHHMAARMEEAGELDRIGAMILFDMIGDADLSFPKDGNGADWLNDIVWETAAEIGHGNVFVDDPPQYMEDDHLPFIRHGRNVAAIDLIDWSYGPANRNWHSPFDTMDKLAAGSFQAVGETVLSALPVIVERVQR